MSEKEIVFSDSDRLTTKAIATRISRKVTYNIPLLLAIITLPKNHAT